MKNTIKILGLIVLVAIIGFSMAACDDGNGKDTFTVTFDADNGSTAQTQTVTAGGKASKPENPVKTGYEFVYWFDTATSAEWDFDAAVTAALSLKAKWNEVPRTVYTAGYYINSSGKHVACSWKGAVKTDLTNGTTDAEAWDITVSGGKVYTAGVYTNSKDKYVACYWSGTAKTDLSDGTTDGEALAITVSGGQAYTAGYYKNSGDQSVACSWKGAAKTELSDGTISASARDITVSDGKVYTAGNYRNSGNSGGRLVACYWEHQIPLGHGSLVPIKIDLSDGATNAIAFGVTVSGGKVYTAGRYTNSDGKYVACYWEGAAKTDLSDGTTNAEAWRITVSGGKVYTAGYYINSGGKHVACYWEGATKTDLSDGTTHAEAWDITVPGEKVYTAGLYTNSSGKTVACYWEGTTKTDLSDGTSDAEACGIDVQ